jgi:hypothetical protein
MARTMTLFGWVPVMINPPIRTLSPVSTRRRVEMLPNALTPGVPAGVGVGVWPGVAVVIAVAVGVAAAAVAVAVAVGLGLGIGVGVGVGALLETVILPTIPQHSPCGLQ